MRKLFGCILLLVVGFLTSCQGPIPYIDNVVLARVGDVKLTRPELRSALPSGLSEEDSTAYAEQYIRSWIEEQLLYQQGQKHLKNLKQLDEQVAEYRRTLISRTYEQQLLEKEVRAISDNECWSYYEQEASRLKLDRPILQGLYIKTLTSNGGLDEVRRNIRNLSHGKADEVELIETYCLQRAVAYDNFFQRWVSLETVLSKLPAAFEQQAAHQLAQKGDLVETADSLYTYLIFVKDYRSAGESKPYEYALPEIREHLLYLRRRQVREAVMQKLLDEAVRKKEVVTSY